MGRYGPQFDPVAINDASVRPGPVLFNIINLSSYKATFSVRRHGHTLARTPTVPPGKTAQLKVLLSGSGNTFNAHGVTLRDTLSTSNDLRLKGPPRTGDNDVYQP